MCQDPPGQRLRRIAVCACHQHFPECDLEDAKRHITKYSGPAHRWVYIADDVAKEIPRTG